MTNYKYNYSFDSVSEFAEYVDKLPHSDYDTSQAKRAASWCTMDYADTMARAKRGGDFPEGAQALAEVDMDLSGDDGAQKLGLRRNVVGFMPDVPAYLSGEPLNMLEARPIANPKKFIKVGFHPHQVSYVTTQQVLNRGRAVLAVLDALALEGFAIELWMVDVNDSSDSQCVTKVKDSDTPWNADSAAFFLADASFARRLLFRFLEGHDELKDICNNGYGRSNNPPSDELEFDVYFPWFKGAHCDTEKEAFEYYLQEFKDQAGIKTAEGL
tara:strand:+ start:1565 stop:2374 length:810 start_codon:yes stop_codon:yes gene_type:complete